MIHRQELILSVDPKRQVALAGQLNHQSFTAELETHSVGFLVDYLPS
jgi:hypothetical protein